MSVYADYDVLSHHYDVTRLADGAHLYLGLVYSLCGKTAENLNLLDLGSGTGNHVRYLLENGLGRATLLDANNAMLDKARDKLKTYQERIVIQQHRLPTIPFQDGEFDVVMSNQVLQHLTDEMDTDFNAVRILLKEAFRVLKPNGVIIVNFSTPFQFEKGQWWSESLFRESYEKHGRRVAEQKQFLQMLRDAGFVREGMITEPLRLTYTEERYFDEEGPLSEQWRSAGSCTAAVTPNELERIVTEVSQMKEDGTLRDYMKQNDEMREHIGQYAIFYAKK